MDADAVRPMGAAAVGLGALWGAGLELWGEAVPSTGPWPRGDGCDMEEDNRSATCLGAGQVEPPRALPTQRIPGALQLYFLSSVSGPPQTLVPIQHALGRRCGPGEPREGVGSAVCGELIPAFTKSLWRSPGRRCVGSAGGREHLASPRRAYCAPSYTPLLKVSILPCCPCAGAGAEQHGDTDAEGTGRRSDPSAPGDPRLVVYVSPQLPSPLALLRM